MTYIDITLMMIDNYLFYGSELDWARIEADLNFTTETDNDVLRGVVVKKTGDGR